MALIKRKVMYRGEQSDARMKKDEMLNVKGVCLKLHIQSFKISGFCDYGNPRSISKAFLLLITWFFLL